MKTIKLVVLVLVSFLLAVSSADCQTKNSKMEEFLIRYSNETNKETFRKNGIVMGEHEKFYSKVNSVEIRSIKTKEVGDVTVHFVKAKIIYDYNPKFNGVVTKEKFYRWMALVVEEDGFGTMLAVQQKSKERMSITFSGKLMPGSYETGESIIK